MNIRKHKQKGLLWIHKAILLAFMDSLIILASYLAALLMRFDFRFSAIPVDYLQGYVWSMPFWITATIVVFYGCRLYHSVWRLASFHEARMMVTSYMILAVVYTVGTIYMHLHMPKSYYFMGYILSFCLTTGIRFSYRLIRAYIRHSSEFSGGQSEDRIMVIGAGSAGQVLIKELINSDKVDTKVCCVIDDNPNKIGKMLEGIPIVGNRYSIVEMVKKYRVNHIIYAIPATTGKNRKDILNLCKDTGCRMQTVPGVYQLVNGEVSVSKLRNVEDRKSVV